MEKALEIMPSGIVSIWTHKAILPEIVSIMHGLGMLMPLARDIDSLQGTMLQMHETNLT